MKNGFAIFLTAFLVLVTSWTAFVLGPQLQLGRAKQVAVLNSSDVYPTSRPGEAAQGLVVYRANGCAACHTEQVQQDGVVCEVVLSSAGKNPSVVSNLLATLKLSGITEEEALAAGDAAAPLQAANRVIEPAMDDFAVARRGLETDRVGTFEDEHAMAGKRQRPSHRETHDTRPDDDALNLVHHISWAEDSCRI